MTTRWKSFCCLCAIMFAFDSASPLKLLDNAFPTRPIRVIATSSAGGTSDIFMRALGEELHKRLGQPLIVENRPGGAFNIGARACAEAAPDGYTYLHHSGRAAGVQPVHVQDAALRSGDRLRADHAALLHHPGAGGQRRAQCEDAAGARHAVEGEAGNAELLHRGYSGGRVHGAMEEADRRRPGEGPVPRRRRGGRRAADRRHAGRALRHRQHALAARGRQRARLAVDSDARSPLFPTSRPFRRRRARHTPRNPISA